MTSSSVVLHNWRPSVPNAVCASMLEHPSNTQNWTFFLPHSYHIHWSSPSSLSEAPGSVKCRISKWTKRCAHKGPGILASCFSGVAEAPWPLSGGGWLYDFRKVRLTSLGISLRIYKMTSLKQISHIGISSNVSQHLSALSSLVLAFCSFPDAYIFLGDKPNFTSDDLPSEMAHSLMTLFNSIKSMVQLIRYLLSIFRYWWWCHHTLWSRSCKDAADLDSRIYPCSPGASMLMWKWSLPDENLFPIPGLGEISL